jgi:hypothetical protein
MIVRGTIGIYRLPPEDPSIFPNRFKTYHHAASVAVTHFIAGPSISNPTNPWLMHYRRLVVFACRSPKSILKKNRNQMAE